MFTVAVIVDSGVLSGPEGPTPFLIGLAFVLFVSLGVLLTAVLATWSAIRQARQL